MKNDNNNLFGGFQQSLKKMKGKLQFLETSVPVEKQMEYFRYSEKIKDSVQPTSIEKQIEILQAPESSPKELRYALAYLAVSGNIEAYRMIESYSKEHQDEWTMMSLVQAKITLESELSGEKKIFISTGLGGKKDKLRFTAFFKTDSLRPFLTYQRELIEKELRYTIEQCGGETEEVNIAENYCILLFLVDIGVDIKAMFGKAIRECNQYGNFLNNSYTITNVRLFTEEDIQRELHHK
jgi:hypothetical protein